MTGLHHRIIEDMPSSSSCDATPRPRYDVQEFARKGEGWQLTFKYTHFTPDLEERHHTLSLLQHHGRDAYGDHERKIIFHKSRAHGWWEWCPNNNNINIIFKFSGSNRLAFPHYFKCISKQGSGIPSWRFDKENLEHEPGTHICYMSHTKYTHYTAPTAMASNM